MKSYISNEIIVENPSKELLSWCRTNLIYNNPEYANKLRMGLWLGNTPRRLYMYKVLGNKIILPFGVLKRVWHLLKNAEYSVDFKVKKIYPVSRINLYDYQENAVQRMQAAKNGVLVSKAGSGKTQMMLELICRLGYKALWINNKKDLLNQALDRAKANIVNCTFGTITEGKVNIGDITFSTIQTLSKIDLDEIKNEFGIIICDEFQNFSGTPTKLTQTYKVLSKLSARYKFGCTACVHRSDGLMQAGLDLVGDVVYEVPESAIADKIIRAKVQPVHTNFTPKTSLAADGTISDFSSLVNEICYDNDRNSIILNNLRQNQDNHCLVLSDRLDQLKYLQSQMGCGLMIDGNMVTKKGKEQRRQAIEKMKTGEEKILFASYSLAKEGLDIPILDRLFMASPKKDKSVIIQAVGRIERVHKGKTNPIVYDYVDDFDENFNMLKNMYSKRKTIYRKNGNEINE